MSLKDYLFYQDDWATIYCGDCLEIMPLMEPESVDLVLTDPPYGIKYRSNWEGVLDREIVGDFDISLRNKALSLLNGIPKLVFGTRKAPVPLNTRMVLIWDKQGALGMGALDLPWKPSYEEIYVIGKGFFGYRGGAVLSFPPCQATAWRGRQHPMEKPINLLKYLLQHSPVGIVLDPFLGSGTTCVASKNLNRKSIGIEINPRYCEISVRRLRQEVFDFRK